jgi:hypothetical protein
VINYHLIGKKESIPDLFAKLKAAEVDIKREHRVLMINKTSVSRKVRKRRENSRRVARMLPLPRKSLSWT